MRSSQLREVVDSGGESASRKSVLFCPTCGHRAPTGGDWVVTERAADGGRRRVYDCPACQRTLVEQPVLEPAPA